MAGIRAVQYMFCRAKYIVVRGLNSFYIEKLRISSARKRSYSSIVVPRERCCGDIVTKSFRIKH